ncbi:hypothetical protein AB838_12565 [Rhodobacteraceae bacterium (ex Bugula neritina AB1)]|nr:hypothetical protein AB838_12565 [Rhodobacteraceae bacterium (ex Bugula neritina AB1)]
MKKAPDGRGFGVQISGISGTSQAASASRAVRRMGRRIRALLFAARVLGDYAAGQGPRQDPLQVRGMKWGLTLLKNWAAPAAAVRRLLRLICAAFGSRSYRPWEETLRKQGKTYAKLLT